MPDTPKLDIKTLEFCYDEIMINKERALQGLPLKTITLQASMETFTTVLKHIANMIELAEEQEKGNNNVSHSQL